MRISIRTLLIASIGYLLLPFCIFLFGWVHPIFAVAVFVALSLVIMRGTREVGGTIFLSKKTALIGGFFLFILLLLAVAGHKGPSDGDVVKHSAILNDLVSYSWPVTYRITESHQYVHLVYYFAYYLPAAVVGKVFGWLGANIALFVWTYIGFSIAFAWMMSFVNEKKQTWYCLLFPLFSGLDIVGRIIMWRRVHASSDWEWWAGIWQYSGNTTLIFYVPQHVIAGWICTGIILFLFIKQKKLPLQELALASTFLWSPFIFIGLLPFYFLLFIQKRLKIQPLSAILGCGILFFEILFFISNMTFSSPETRVNGFLWQVEKLVGGKILITLLLFYILEFGLFILFIFRAKKPSLIFITAVAILFILPWYKIGLFNDFVMRTSIPALYILCMYWLGYLIEIKKRSAILIVAWLLFIVGAAYPLVLMERGATHFSLVPTRGSFSLIEPKFRKQYVGSSQSLFFTLFPRETKGGKIGQFSLTK